MGAHITHEGTDDLTPGDLEESTHGNVLLSSLE